MLAGELEEIREIDWLIVDGDLEERFETGID